MDDVPLFHRHIFCLLIVYTEYMWPSTQGSGRIDMVPSTCSSGFPTCSLWSTKYFSLTHFYIASMWTSSLQKSNGRLASVLFVSAFCSGLSKSTVYAMSNSGIYYRLLYPSSRSGNDPPRNCIDVSCKRRVGELISFGSSDKYHILECDMISQKHKLVSHLLHFYSSCQRSLLLFLELYSHSNKVLGLDVRGVWLYFSASFRWCSLSDCQLQAKSYEVMCYLHCKSCRVQLMRSSAPSIMLRLYRWYIKLSSALRAQ
jgi:hypothetical protein